VLELGKKECGVSGCGVGEGAVVAYTRGGDDVAEYYNLGQGR